MLGGVVAGCSYPRYKAMRWWIIKMLRTNGQIESGDVEDLNFDGRGDQVPLPLIRHFDGRYGRLHWLVCFSLLVPYPDCFSGYDGTGRIYMYALLSQFPN